MGWGEHPHNSNWFAEILGIVILLLTAWLIFYFIVDCRHYNKEIKEYEQGEKQRYYGGG